MQKIFSKKIFKVAIVAAILWTLVVTNPSGFFDPIRNVLMIISAPFQKISYSFGMSIRNTRDFLEQIGELKRENERLIKEKEQLISESAQLKDVSQENEILREQLNLLPRDHYDMVAASVIGQDPNGMGNWLEINRGSSDGIKEGDSVIISKGILVGRIKNVGPKTSKVILLTNPESTINVTTLNGTKGVAKGEYGLGIKFEMILQTASINADDEVITSGIGGDIPRGLYLGKVKEVRAADDYLFQQAAISSPVQPAKLQVLFVIKNVK